MSTLFKDRYNEVFYDQLGQHLKSILPSFKESKFKRLIFSNEFESLELKERMMHTCQVLHEFLPSHYPDAIASIIQLIEFFNAEGIQESDIEYMFLPEYISRYGMQDVTHSLKAMEKITQFTSCEFAVRPFIIAHEQRMLKQMLRWSKHKNNKVRRLATEGIRPRLPWAMALPSFKQDPSPLFPILDNLKRDPCDVVRRSVANNLNDISKDNPDFVVAVAEQWYGVSPDTDALVKHACRTLLKQAHPRVMSLFGFSCKNIKISDFMISTPQVLIGERLRFSFVLFNTSSKSQKVRLEYGLYYKKNNGSLSRKVFKISERMLESKIAYDFTREQSFKLITTRKFYSGEHRLSLIINGVESEQVLSFDFLLD